MRVKWYKKYLVNNGKVIQFKAEDTLEYTHLSSISRLPDKPESYSHVILHLEPNGDQTKLTVTLKNFPTYEIYKHLEFYWNVTPAILKKFVEDNASLV